MKQFTENNWQNRFQKYFYKKIYFSLLMISLFFSFQLFSNSNRNIPREKINSFNQLMKSTGKLYYCRNCPSQKAEILIPMQWSFEPTETGKEYSIVFNQGEVVNVTKIYIQEKDTWVNLGKKLNLSIDLPEILPDNLYPDDPEIKALLELENPSTISYMSILEKKLLDDINLIRENPSLFAKKVETLLPYTKGNLLSLPNRRPYKLHSDSKSLEKIISKLKAMEKIDKLQTEENLNTGVRAKQSFSDHLCSKFCQLGITHSSARTFSSSSLTFVCL